MTQPQHGPPWKSDPSYGDLTPWQLPPPLLLLYASTDYDMLSVVDAYRVCGWGSSANLFEQLGLASHHRGSSQEGMIAASWFAV